MTILEVVAECVVKGDHRGIGNHIQSALDKGVNPDEVLNNGLLKGMDVVGERFRKEECFVPEVMVAARAMHAGLDILKPRLLRTGIQSPGTILMGTVKGDIHDIGKNIVSIMLEGAGFRVIDMGVDVLPQKFVEEAHHSGAHVVGLSALLTTTIPAMAHTIELLKKSAIKERVKVIVGGAPVNESIAAKVGADGYGKNAGDAVYQVKKLLGLPWVPR